MKEAIFQFKQITRTYMVRTIQIVRDKGLPSQAQQIQTVLAKILASGQVPQIVITRLASQQLKTDYHQILILLYLQQLTKWCKQYNECLKEKSIIMESLLQSSINLLQNQQEYHTIVPKQNELISHLLCLPYCIENLQSYKKLYRRLKEIKQFYPSTVKQSQRILFSKTIEDSITVIAEIKHLPTFQFLFKNIVCEIDMLQPTNIQVLPSRLKILKKFIKVSWDNNEQFLRRTAYIVMKLSQHALSSNILFGHLCNLYECIIKKYMQFDSLVPLILFEHFVLNNLVKIKNQYVLLEVLLQQIASIFSPQKMKYFLRLYDWNFMAQGLCQKSMQTIFSYTEDHSNQKKTQYQLYRRCLKNITQGIQDFLDGLSQQEQGEEKYKFYNLKRKEYEEMIVDINQSPKKIFKKLGALNAEAKQLLSGKIIRILIRSPHLEKKAMINLLASDNPISKELLDHYLNVLMAKINHNDFQQFLRIFISNFFLSGQAQQIQRAMDLLTQYFFKHQQQSSQAQFKNSDAAYFFANAIIILNTDLHNPRNQTKMSKESFFKICKNSNAGQCFPEEMLTKTYNNIKKYEIHNFREMNKMTDISYRSWTVITSDPNFARLTYYDEDMDILNNGGFQLFAKDLLSNIINEKQDAKLQAMVERFEYDEKNFHCEIIQDIRKSVGRRPQLPIHILQKIYETANFKNSKPSDSTLSYYWLAVKLIENFHTKLPMRKICELLILTLGLRSELEDHLNTRQKAQFKRIKKCIKQYEKKQSKKSIMDIFTSFLSNQQSEDESRHINVRLTKKMNYQGFGMCILGIIENSKENKSQAVDFLISFIRNDEAKAFQDFMSALSLIFHLLNFCRPTQQSKDIMQQILQMKESGFASRVQSLNQKDPKKYKMLVSYCQYEILKVMLKEYENSQDETIDKILEKCYGFLQMADKSILIDILDNLKSVEQLPSKFLDQVHFIIKMCGEKTDDFQWFLQKFPQPKEIIIQNEAKAQKIQEVQNKKKQSDPKQQPNKEKTQIKQQQPIIEKKSEQLNQTSKTNQQTLQQNETKPGSQKQIKETSQLQQNKQNIQKQKNLISSQKSLQKEQQQLRKKEEQELEKNPDVINSPIFLF